MRIVNWNIEWMNHWFTGNAAPAWGSGALGAGAAREAAGRAAQVIRALAPDLLTVQEGPSALAEMALFLADFLDDGYLPLIGADGREQKIYALVRKGGAVAAADHATDPLTEALKDSWDADVNGDMLLEGYDFTRLPLVIRVDPVGGAPITVIAVHTKSKYVHEGQELFQNPATRQQYVTQALLARRRISAEAFRLRSYLDALVAADPAAEVLVTGDFNDGPGHDHFERSYLTHSVADILLGSSFYPELLFRHALIAHVAPAALFTARFDDFVDGVMDRPLLLDHALASPALAPRVTGAGIAHAEFEAATATANGPRERRASDHRPIWVEIGPAAG